MDLERVGVRDVFGHGKSRDSCHDHVTRRGMGALWDMAQRRCARSVPNRIRVADAQPTDDSAIGATQASEVPLGRYGEIEELANLMMLLLSDGCDYLTGETICIDGGHHLAAPPTFAGLSKLSDDAWRKILESSKTASAASKAQRTV